MSVDVNLAKTFVAALRSGEYDQVRGSLISYPGEIDHPEDRGLCYCAEGVLVMSALKGGFSAHTAVFEIDETSHRESGYLNDETLIRVFGEWVPVRVWNDSEELSFAEIADKLEERFPEIKV